VKRIENSIDVVLLRQGVQTTQYYVLIIKKFRCLKAEKGNVPLLDIRDKFGVVLYV